MHMAANSLPGSDCQISKPQLRRIGFQVVLCDFIHDMSNRKKRKLQLGSYLVLMSPNYDHGVGIMRTQPEDG